MYSYYLLIRRGIIRRNKIQVWPTQRGSQLLNLAPCPQNVFMQVILEQTHAVISEWKTPDSKTNSKKKKKEGKCTQRSQGKSGLWIETKRNDEDGCCSGVAAGLGWVAGTVKQGMLSVCIWNEARAWVRCGGTSIHGVLVPVVPPLEAVGDGAVGLYYIGSWKENNWDR